MKFENTEVWGFEHAIRGMRNPMNSWDKSDSRYLTINDIAGHPCDGGLQKEYVIGETDLKLMQKLIRAGSEHRKFLRQIFVSVDITAPLYWWKEFDTYKVGTVANSTSTMHKIMSQEFEPNMFEIANIRGYKKEVAQKVNINFENEIWKPYPYSNLYEISNYGRIKRKCYVTSNNHTLPEVILKWQISSDGYAYVGVKTEKTNGKIKNRRVHTLVGETFLTKKNDKYTTINHKDGNKLNNYVDNLEWCTPEQNNKHRAENNLQPQGLSTYTGKLTKEEREEILFRLDTENISRRQIAKEYHVSHSTINSLINGDYDYGENFNNDYQDFLKIIDKLNLLRDEYLQTKNKQIWYSLITILPESWLQKRTITMNYENLLMMYRQRKSHKLNEWSGLDNSKLPNYISWIKSLPYADELICIE